NCSCHILFSYGLTFSVKVMALNKPHILQRRGLIQLAGAIQCGTGRSAVHYIGYGLICGLTRSWPALNQHDCCYEFAEKYGCKTKLGHYSWTCKDNTVKCGRYNTWTTKSWQRIQTKYITAVQSRVAPVQFQKVIASFYLCFIFGKHAFQAHLQ
uniref:Phospholipase A2-like central domain-containing protein n=1 Tax=Xenopus tropicalis TaxID=8364 RepID=A0A6I8QGY7_XENTR